MASLWTNKGVFLVMSGSIDLDSTVLKYILVKAAHTPSVDDNFVSGMANECDAPNYVRKTLASQTVTEDDTNDRATFDAADPSAWTSLGGVTNNTLRHGAVIQDTGSDATSPILMYNDMGSDKTTNGGDFTASFAAAGIGYISTV